MSDLGMPLLALVTVLWLMFVVGVLVMAPSCSTEKHKLRQAAEEASKARDKLRDELGVRKEQFLRLAYSYEELQHRADKLEDAITVHYSQRKHDRCWHDDKALYVAAGLNVDDEDFKLPPLEEWMPECAKFCTLFWLKRQPPANS